MARKPSTSSPVLDALTRASQASAAIERSGLTAPSVPASSVEGSPDDTYEATIAAEDTYREDEEA